MTRANIVRNIINDDGYYYTKHSVLEIVNVIFDEHEAHLMDRDDEIELLKHRIEELIKPKTCEVCNHLFFDEIEEVYKCINDVSDDVGYLHGEAVIRNIKDFYCAQYRSKDNA